MNAVLAHPVPAKAPGRFPPLTRAGFVVTLYLLAVGIGFIVWHRMVADVTPGIAVPISLAPALLAAVFAATHQTDRRQYAARLGAVGLMSPIGLLFWTIDDPSLGLGCALAIGFAVLHAGAFVAGVVWMGRFSTRIDATQGIAAVDAATLLRRLASLRDCGLPLALHTDNAHAELNLSWQPSDQPERLHSVRLRLVAPDHEVRVHERLGADDAPPLSADEASMRSPGEPAFDPTRPDAQRTWMRTVQATMLDAGHLAGAPVALAGDRVVWTGRGLPTLPDTDALMACLATIVLGSGWHWRPALND